jgi:hypothetical protein
MYLPCGLIPQMQAEFTIYPAIFTAVLFSLVSCPLLTIVPQAFSIIQYTQHMGEQLCKFTDF